MKHLITGLFFFGVSLTASAADTPPLTESEALRSMLSRPEVGNVLQVGVELAEADALAAGLVSNPTLDYRRDRTTGITTRVEQSAQISQTFDISGRRGLRREAAERRVLAARQEAETRRSEMVAEVRRRFYEVVLHTDMQRAVGVWSERMAQIEAVITKLERAGEVSGYDRRRLVRERAAAQARAETEQADLERARERLGALIGDGVLDSQRGVRGALLPEVPAPMEDLSKRLSGLPGLKALEERAAAADIEGKAAGRGSIPDVTLGVGPKWADDGTQRDTGLALSISMPLPIFDRQQVSDQRASAMAVQARSELALAKAQAEADLRGLWKQAQRLRVASMDFRARAASGSGELIRIAEAAYRAGESSLLELLDAYRGALEAETTAIELEWKARMSHIELDQLTGFTAP